MTSLERELWLRAIGFRDTLLRCGAVATTVGRLPVRCERIHQHLGPHVGMTEDRTWLAFGSSPGLSSLLASLRAKGVTLEPRGDKLRVVPASAVTPEEVEALRRLKAEVLEVLSAPPVPGLPLDSASGAALTSDESYFADDHAAPAS